MKLYASMLKNIDELRGENCKVCCKGTQPANLSDVAASNRLLFGVPILILIFCSQRSLTFAFDIPALFIVNLTVLWHEKPPEVYFQYEYLS